MYFLDQFKINSRLLVVSNLSNQYIFQDFKYRLSNGLVNTDTAINQTLCLRRLSYFGKAKWDFIAKTITDYFTN